METALQVAAALSIFVAGYLVLISLVVVLFVIGTCVYKFGGLVSALSAGMRQRAASRTGTEAF